LLGAKGLMPLSGTEVDATLSSAPSATKNASGECDPELHQSKKGQQCFFGMKGHIGVDANSGLVHTVRGTAGRVNDVVEADSLLHGQETDVFADAPATRVRTSELTPRTMCCGMWPCGQVCA